MRNVNAVMTADPTPEQSVLTKISGALGVLEHRKGSALIPATCAEALRSRSCCCGPPELTVVTIAPVCRDVRTAVRAGGLNPTESQLSVRNAKPA